MRDCVINDNQLCANRDIRGNNVTSVITSISADNQRDDNSKMK